MRPPVLGTGCSSGATWSRCASAAAGHSDIVSSCLTVLSPVQKLQLQLNQDLSLLHQDDGSSKNKRGVLPKHATNVMRSWLFQHIGVSY